MSATRACASCGAVPYDGARFCHACGAALAAATAKYKQVTVLFADVVRSMDLAAALDIERLREIMTEVVERCAAVVQRYGGTPEYNGDGVMALFGAPVALEDHAFRACLAALAIQEEAERLAAEVLRRDGVTLRLRVGLNSGRVIAGDIGSGSLGYAATGQHVGMAQRMESAAQPGGVMLSQSTAELVDQRVVLGEPEPLRIKGTDAPVWARRLVSIGPRTNRVGRVEASLVGRRWEMAALGAMVDRAIGGHGGVVNIVGPPGIGKSRVAREAAALAARRGVEVFWVFCESHARDVPFGVVARLLRTGIGADDVDDDDARLRLRDYVPDEADPQDLLLLDDLLGIADPNVSLPQIDPDARRRRLTALVNTTTLARTEPALYIVEDAHWIDTPSEALLADFLTVIPRTPSIVLVTARPEYEGSLLRVHSAQTIALAPLADSDTSVLLDELLGPDPSVRDVARIIGDRAAGNPFFTEEMVRELVQRGVLTGDRGGYRCLGDIADVSVPATVQAAIGARIDSLSVEARQTLNAASVIGARFGTDLFEAIGVEPVFDELICVELIDQVRFTPKAEYAFHHPLIRAVAYETQLKSDRAQWHRRLADAILARAPGSADDNAAMIAQHLEAAGELHSAYDWHMRAGSWSTNRDLGAARVSWEHALRIADTLPEEHPDELAMRIAPRTMLCGTDWRVHVNVSDGHFDELRELCRAAGDNASLAIATTSLAMDHAYHARLREASQVASEAVALIESVGDPSLAVGLSVPLNYAKVESGEWPEVLRLSDNVIELARDDPFMGNIIMGCPLAIGYATRGIARYFSGRPGWRDDQRTALALAHDADAVSYAAVVSFGYAVGTVNGTLRPDDSAICEIENCLRTAERAGDDLAVANARVALGLTLAHRDSAAERDQALPIMKDVCDTFVRKEHNLADLPMVRAYIAREQARRGDRDGAIAAMRAVVDHEFADGRSRVWGAATTGTLVQTLLDRGDDGDCAEAEAAVARLAAADCQGGTAMHDIWLLRLGALLAGARGDGAGYRESVSRYRAMAETLGFDGHIDWATALLP